MNEKISELAGKDTARRRLLRGTFAAPAVLTLASGSALAATSVTCVAKQVDSPEDAPPNPAGTMWVRVPLWEKRQNVNRYSRFVSGAQIAMLFPPGGAYLSTTQWQCVSVVGTSTGFTAESIYSDAEVGTGLGSINSDPLVQLTEYVALRIDETGQVVGVQDLYTDTGASAMHVSCWTSFGGTNAFP